jgi:hypothetical protein
MAEGFLDMIRRHKQELEDALGGKAEVKSSPTETSEKEPAMSGEELDRELSEYKKKYPSKSDGGGFKKATGK